ncbi:MAG: aspartate aminotransferase family protein [Verrucomicrobiota bacterium]|nr:aspartate aminotransferase family protein [Verrucomicrobiota bacterium]
MPFDIKSLVSQRLGENYDLHHQYVNQTLVDVQRTIGFDKVYSKAKGAYLFDQQGNQYLDFLSGYSVFNIGRNHPVLQQTIRDVLEMDLPNMVQMDCALLSGLLAEALVKRSPKHIEAVFFCNSGTEANEGAFKFARCATGRPRLLSLEHCYHGLSYGSLSATANKNFQEGFGPFLPGFSSVPYGDLETLENELKKKDVAAFIVEPVQGKGVYYPKDDYFQKALQLCRKYGTLWISDEVQTGMGRTGKYYGFQHWDLEPDIITMAKALSGGYVPCAAILTRRSIYQKTFSRLDRCVVHSTTFGRNNLAMACGLATLDVIDKEGLVENCARMGDLLVQKVNDLRAKHEYLGEVRGKGLMIGIDFIEPKSFLMKQGWKFIHTLDQGLFAQMIVTCLISKHRILSQVASHNSDTLKILPPLIITEKEVDYFVSALDDVLTECRKFPGPMWELAKNFLGKAKQNKEQKNENLASVYVGSNAGRI